MMPQDQGAPMAHGIPTDHEPSWRYADEEAAEPYVAVQVHRHPPASEPVWHRRFLVVEDALARTGHTAERSDHHSQVCPLCTALRSARGGAA